MSDYSSCSDDSFCSGATTAGKKYPPILDWRTWEKVTTDLFRVPADHPFLSKAPFSETTTFLYAGNDKCDPKTTIPLRQYRLHREMYEAKFDNETVRSIKSARSSRSVKSARSAATVVRVEPIDEEEMMERKPDLPISPTQSGLPAPPAPPAPPAGRTDRSSDDRRSIRTETSRRVVGTVPLSHPYAEYDGSGDAVVRVPARPVESDRVVVPFRPPPPSYPKFDTLIPEGNGVTVFQSQPSAGPVSFTSVKADQFAYCSSQRPDGTVDKVVIAGKEGTALFGKAMGKFFEKK